MPPYAPSDTAAFMAETTGIDGIRVVMGSQFCQQRTFKSRANALGTLA
jgi:hypothetical protein